MTTPREALKAILGCMGCLEYGVCARHYKLGEQAIDQSVTPEGGGSRADKPMFEKAPNVTIHIDWSDPDVE